MLVGALCDGLGRTCRERYVWSQRFMNLNICLAFVLSCTALSVDYLASKTKVPRSSRKLRQMTSTISPAELENCKRAFSITDKEGMLPLETLHLRKDLRQR